MSCGRKCSRSTRAPIRLGARAGFAVAFVSVLVVAAPARAQRWETAAARREALFDIAVAAMAHGDLDLAERAFLDAAAVPGDPVRSAVSASFAGRVRRLREKRLQQPVVTVLSSGPEATVRARAPEAPAVEPERSQRSTFVAITSVLGASLYGWTVPAALSVPAEQSRRFLGYYMLTVAGSFLGPYLATRDRPVTAAQADLALYGGTRGAWHGVMLTAVLVGDATPDQRSQAWARGLLLGSVSELTAGYFLAGDGRLTTGQTHTMAALGDLGLLWGVGAGYLLRFDQRDGADRQARAMGAATLLGSGLGLTGGYLLGRRRANTWGDAEVLRLGGLLGALTGFGIADALKMDLVLSSRPVTGLAIGASALGAAAADRLLRPLDLTVSQALLVDLGTLAGTLGAAGMAYLLTGDGDSRQPYVLLMAVGGVTAFSLSYWAVFDRSTRRARGRGLAVGGASLALLPLVSGGGERGAALMGRF